MTIVKKTMTPNMLRFCENYLETRNATRSYAKGFGYNPDDEKQREKHYASWRASASALLQDDRVQKYLEDRMLEFNYNRELSEDEIMIQLNKIALGSGLYRESTRMDALKQLVRIKGMTDEGSSQQQVNINLSSELTDAVEDARKPLTDPQIGQIENDDEA